MHRLLSSLALLLTVTLLPAAVAAPTSAAPDSESVSERAGGLTVRYRSWGALRIGMTPQRAWRTGMVSREQSYCSSGYQMTEPFAERGFTLWRPVRGNYSKLVLSGMVISGEADRTAAGLGTGTTLRKLRKTYPKLTQLRSWAELNNQPGAQPSRDYWVASIAGHGGHINFQFAYGRKPKAGAKVEQLVVSRKQYAYPGC